MKKERVTAGVESNQIPNNPPTYRSTDYVQERTEPLQYLKLEFLSAFCVRTFLLSCMRRKIFE